VTTATGIDRRSLLGLVRSDARAAPKRPDRRASCFVPQIKAELCEGCDMCARICPCGAMRLQNCGASTSYVVEQTLCDGCDVCVDICDAGAVSVQRGGADATRVVDLSTNICRGCGASFHWPLARGGAGGLCRVCAARAAARLP